MSRNPLDEANHDHHQKEIWEGKVRQGKHNSEQGEDLGGMGKEKTDQKAEEKKTQFLQTTVFTYNILQR